MLAAHNGREWKEESNVKRNSSINIDNLCTAAGTFRTKLRIQNKFQNTSKTGQPSLEMALYLLNPNVLVYDVPM